MNENIHTRVGLLGFFVAASSLGWRTDTCRSRPICAHHLQWPRLKIHFSLFRPQIRKWSCFICSAVNFKEAAIRSCSDKSERNRWHRREPKPSRLIPRQTRSSEALPLRRVLLFLYRGETMFSLLKLTATIPTK